MNILITGGAGYVGSRMVAHLLGQGYDVTVFDLLMYGGESLLPFMGGKRFHFVRDDIRDSVALANVMRGMDAVVHLASVVGEPACSLNEDAAIEINRDAALATLAIAEEQGVGRFVFLSTCSNYGVSDPNTLADEDSALQPLSLYAKTKVEVEEAALGHQGRMTTTVLRLGTICGLSARMRFDLLISEMACAAVRGQTIEIYKPEAWRPFLHIADAGRVVQHILEQNRSRVAGRVFNVVGGNFQKIGLIDLVRNHFPEAKIKVTDAKPDNRDYRVSGARIERELAFTPLHSIEEAFVETAQAIAEEVFHNIAWPGHSAIPLAERKYLLNKQH